MKKINQNLIDKTVNLGYAGISSNLSRTSKNLRETIKKKLEILIKIDILMY